VQLKGVALVMRHGTGIYGLNSLIFKTEK